MRTKKMTSVSIIDTHILLPYQTYQVLYRAISGLISITDYSQTLNF